MLTSGMGSTSLVTGRSLGSRYTVALAGLPAGEVTVDLLDILSDARRLSCLLIVGFGGYSGKGVFKPVHHGGAGQHLSDMVLSRANEATRHFHQSLFVRCSQ